MCSSVQRHQSPERPILHQISSLMYSKIQWRQVIMNILHPGCAWSPQWSLAILWRRFEDGLASICILIHSCKMPKQSETMGLNDGWKWWLVGNATVVIISDKVVPANVHDSSLTPLVQCINLLYICLVNCPAFQSLKPYREYEDPVQMEFGLVPYP